MPRNVEIKARVADLAALEQRVRALGAQGPVDLWQDDTFFICAHGRLKLRELAQDRGELIHYQRAGTAGPKISDYVIATTTDPAVLRETLARALGVCGRVRKHRRLYLVGKTRIHLDRVDGLGTFLELEVVLAEDQTHDDGQRAADALLADLGIRDAELVAGAYLDLLR